MVDDVEAQHDVIRASEVGGEHVPVDVDDATSHSRLRHDPPADGRAARQIKDRGPQLRVRAAQLGREPSVRAPEVEHRSGSRRQAQRPRYFGRRQSRELQLARDVADPALILRAGGVDVDVAPST
jgi:hypothetical protein